MKKLIAFAAVFVQLLATAANLTASQRVVVAEDFTGTWCQYCPAAANGLGQLHEETGDSLLVLAYHYGDPYQTTETYNRIVFYGAMIPGYPTVIFDGLDSIVGSSGSGAAYTNYDYYRPVFDVHKTIPSPFEMAISLVSFNPVSLTGTMEVKVRNTNTIMESGTLHFAVMERNIPVIWQGMTEIDYTVRDMIPDENGESISIPAGDSLTLTRNFILDPSWVVGKCQYAAFIQRADKQIIQGAHLYGPCLAQQSHALTETGDGDGYYEPGESLDLSVWVKNFYSAGTGAEVEAVTSDTFITLTNNLWTIGSMAAGDTLNNAASPFLIGVKASASMPEGHTVIIYINKKIYSGLYGEFVTTADSVSFIVGTPTLAYTEDFENGMSDWKVGYTAYTTGVDWDTTQTDFHSPNTCIVNAEFGDYANKQNRWIRMQTYVDLTGYSAATLSWYEKYDVIAGDRCQPEVSTDSAGSLWSALSSFYSGSVGSWQRRTVDITSFCGNKKYFRIGYRLLTDLANVAKGWSVDDIVIDGYLKQVNIWPGDCDNNGGVNALDILPIGMYWNAMGLSRPNANTSWTAQPGFVWVWPTAAASYADCDGNGNIDIQDVLAIGQNWHQTHSKAKGGGGDILIPENVDLSPYLDNYRQIYQGLSGESDAVMEIKRLLESIFIQYSKRPDQFSMNIRPVSGYGIWQIECNIPRDTRLSLKIYNIMGQEVKTIEKGQYKAGKYIWVWPGNNNEQRKVASGLYVCRLEAPEYSKTVKMVVVR